jgi:small subunit ribosomal protein S3
MGQKVHPTGIRLGIVKDWSSRWYASSKDYARLLAEDLKVRRVLEKRIDKAALSRIEIERPAKNAKITIHTSKPGVIIGKNGKDIEILRDDIGRLLGVPVNINIAEIRKPDMDSKLVAENVAAQLARRISFRRAIKRAISNALRAGAGGVKISVSGRLGGAEIARTEWYHEGRVPLHTLRADIDYGVASAMTTYGIIGVKVWIFKGEILGKPKLEVQTAEKTKDGKKKKSGEGE